MNSVSGKVGKWGTLQGETLLFDLPIPSFWPLPRPRRRGRGRVSAGITTTRLGRIVMSTTASGNFRRKNWTRATFAIILGVRRRVPTRSRRARRRVASRTEGVVVDDPITYGRGMARLFPNSWPPLDLAHLPQSWEELGKLAGSRARYQLSF